MAVSSCSSLLSTFTSGSASHGLTRRAQATRFSSFQSRGARSSSLRINCSAASFSGSGQSAESDENPYQVLGVNPFESFDKIKTVYAKRQKDAEKKGDEAALARIEKAYDKIMMAQLANRKQGLTFGSFEVSKDIKYADRQPIVPWGPRYAPSSKRDILINLAISGVFGIWIICTQSADWKPFQFLIFGYMWRVFDKLKDFEKAEPSVPAVTLPPYTLLFILISVFVARIRGCDVVVIVFALHWIRLGFVNQEEEGEGRKTKGGKRLLRTLGLVFSCVAVCSLAYTGLLNGFELAGQYIPRFLINGQELIVTLAIAVSLFFMGSYYR